MTSFRQDGPERDATTPVAARPQSWRKTAMVVACTMLAASIAAPVHAADMTFFFKNDRDREVVVEVRARDRAMSWPGGGRIWLLEPLARKSVTIECTAGEFICYAGWDNGNDARSFGLGPEQSGRCDACCFVCVDQRTEPVEIRP